PGWQPHHRIYSSDTEIESVPSAANSAESRVVTKVDDERANSTAIKTAPSVVDANMTDPKFVDEDAIGYVQVHTGLLNDSVIFGYMREVSWPMRFLDKIIWSQAHTFCTGHLESEFLPLVQTLVNLLAYPQ
ncbi:hypothetical protein EC988_005172, partial [Linderina pennispora]